MLKPGDKLGSYEILTPLTSGGMAELLLARRTGAGGFSRFVTIKAVHEALDEDDKMVRRFLDEARLSARVEHPHVVHVEDLLHIDGRYYIVMEHVLGCSLAQLFDELLKRQRKVAVEVAVKLAADVAEAVHAAHEATDDHGRPLGIVHRDISPQNVLLSNTGYVKLIDFGVAKADSRLHESTTGHVVGKLRYISPEQATGAPVDRRADVYALAIVLWEMLTMRPLFRGGLEMFEVEDRPPVWPPSRYVPEIPEALDQALLDALAIDPDARPATALELRERILEAVPAAYRVDAPQLVELLYSVLADELDRARTALPKEIGPELSLGQDLQTVIEDKRAADRTRPDLTLPMPEASSPSLVPPARPSPGRGLVAAVVVGALLVGLVVGLLLK